MARKRKPLSWATRDCTTDDLRAGRADEIDLACAAEYIDTLEDTKAELLRALETMLTEQPFTEAMERAVDHARIAIAHTKETYK